MRPQPPGGRPGGLARTVWGREGLLILGSIILIALAIGVGVYVGRGDDAASAAGPVVGEDLHSLVVDPRDPARVLVGGHQSAAESRDGGAHWNQIGGLDGTDPMGWLVDPRDPRQMVVGGHPGLRLTADGGATWADATGSLPTSDVHALGMDPGHPDVLYAYLAGQGIYRSGDRGGHWGLVSAAQTPIGPILVDPRSSSTLYVADTQGTFRRSTDGGRTWLGLGTIPGGMVTWMAQDQQRPGMFYAANGGIRCSTDGGHTWLAPAGATAVAVAPSDGRTLYAAGLQGTSAWASRPGGPACRSVRAMSRTPPPGRAMIRGYGERVKTAGTSTGDRWPAARDLLPLRRRPCCQGCKARASRRTPARISSASRAV